MNSQAFLFGVYFFLVCLAQIFVYVVIAKLIRVRITEFSVFTMFSKTLVSKTIDGIKYSLGWLPFSAGIGVLGADEEEYNKLDKEDKYVSLLSKSYGQRLLFQSGPLLASIFVLIVIILLMNLSVGQFAEYMVNVFKAITGSFSKEDIESQTLKLIQENGLLTVTFLLYMSFSVLSYVFNFISVVVSDPKIFTGAGKYISIVFNLAGFAMVIYLLFWKIPVFFSYYFSVGEIIIVALNYYVAATLTGIAGYFVVVYAAKLQSK